jgi:hypothetical protein
MKLLRYLERITTSSSEVDLKNCIYFSYTVKFKQLFFPLMYSVTFNDLHYVLVLISYYLQIRDATIRNLLCNVLEACETVILRKTVN